MLFEAHSVRFNAAKAGDARYTINLEFPDRGETLCVLVGDGVATLSDGVTAGSIRHSGNPAAVRAQLASLDEIPCWFNLVTP